MKQRPQAPSQLSLFEPVEIKPPEIKDRTLEERAVSEPLQGINHLVDYGVTFAELGSFQSKPSEKARAGNYKAIKEAFYGINNMESFDGRFGVPHEMLAMMKPFEIVGLYIGIAQVKRDGAYSADASKRLRHDAMMIQSISEFGRVINDLVNIAYQYHAIKVMANKKSNKIESLSLKERMQSISEDSKERLINVFAHVYREPGSATGRFPHEFRDPHPEDKPDYTGINIYRRHVAGFMHALFAINTKSAK